MKTLKSMTAYARHQQIIGPTEYVWELRSVNHRYLDTHFRLPDELAVMEQALKEGLSTQVARGRLDITLSVREGVEGEQNLRVNTARVVQWVRWQEQVQEVMPSARPLSVMQILTDPEVFEADETEGADEAAVMESFARALGLLLQQRKAEGARLQQVLEEKLAEISKIVDELIENMARYEKAHQKKWRARVDKLHEDELDPVRLYQELALLISRADVTEEIDRLKSHIEEFRNTLDSDKPVGRRLDFLLQEFNREANTLGSKSIHQEITNASVELKVLIDQLREQVQNLE